MSSAILKTSGIGNFIRRLADVSCLFQVKDEDAFRIDFRFGEGNTPIDLDAVMRAKFACLYDAMAVIAFHLKRVCVGRMLV